LNELRVAMIIQAYLPRIGGAERQLAALAPLLQAEGCDVHVITRRFPGLAPFELINDVPVHRLPIPGPKFVASGSFTLSAMPLLKRIRPHILHAHELLSPSTTAVAAKRAFGIPVVAKVLRGGLLGDIAKLKRKFLGQRRMRLFRKYIDAFIVISREIDEELAEFGISNSSRRAIPNGVDTLRFQPVSSDKKSDLRRLLYLPDAPIVVYSGRLVAEKRLDLLIDIWPKIRKVHKDAFLLILGEGETERMLKERQTCGMEFRGAVADVVPYLQSADLFVLPSSTEGLSNALLEALACGICSVATSVGGTRDVIIHGENGWLVPAEQPAHLMEAILMLLSDSELRRNLGQAGRNQILQNYSLSSVASQLVSLYREIGGPQEFFPAKNQLLEPNLCTTFRES